MPVLSRFYGMVVKMYFLGREHNPPHVHFIYGEYIGAIDIQTQEMLEKILGTVKMDPGILAEQPNTRPKAPGMRYRHYAPKADLTIVEGPEKEVVSKIRELAGQQMAQGIRVGIICTDETRTEYSGGDVKSIGARSDEASIARHLYGILREFDDDHVEVIYSEVFDTPKMGQAIMNRLLKAAGHKRLKV